MAAITEREVHQVEAASISGRTPVVAKLEVRPAVIGHSFGGRSPDRRPLLIVSGAKDHTVPWAIATASFQKQRHNSGVTEIAEIPNRGHTLTIDSGWREVAQTALDFVKRFV